MDSDVIKSLIDLESVAINKIGGALGLLISQATEMQKDIRESVEAIEIRPKLELVPLATIVSAYETIINSSKSLKKDPTLEGLIFGNIHSAVTTLLEAQITPIQDWCRDNEAAVDYIDQITKPIRKMPPLEGTSASEDTSLRSLMGGGKKR